MFSRQSTCLILSFGLLMVFQQSTGEDLDDRVVGGQPSIDGEFPYQVSLQMENYHFCGGSIIGNCVILTAAHCTVNIANFPDIITVVAGTNNISSDGIRYQARKVIIHPNYNRIGFHNDVSLIFVKKRIVFNYYVQPVHLPETDTIDGTLVTLTGWGQLDRLNLETPKLLQKITLKVYPNDKCKQVYPTLTSKHVCTYTKFGEGACFGDSGGPLVEIKRIPCEGKRHILVGAVSFGRACARGFPDGFTKIYTILDWIANTIKENTSCKCKFRP